MFCLTLCSSDPLWFHFQSSRFSLDFFLIYPLIHSLLSHCVEKEFVIRKMLASRSVQLQNMCVMCVCLCSHLHPSVCLCVPTPAAVALWVIVTPKEMHIYMYIYIYKSVCCCSAVLNCRSQLTPKRSRKEIWWEFRLFEMGKQKSTDICCWLQAQAAICIGLLLIKH